MSVYERLSKNPALFQSLLGISVEECSAIVEKIEKIYPKVEKKRLSRKNRKCAIDAGRRFSLNIRDRVLLTLFYFRTYSSQRLVAFVFRTIPAIVSRIINHMVPLLKKCIPIPAKIHDRTKRFHTVE